MTDNTDAVIVSQEAMDAAEEAVSAANIVTNDGYYEIDIDKVSRVIARFEQATLASQSAALEAVRAERDTLALTIGQKGLAAANAWETRAIAAEKALGEAAKQLELDALTFEYLGKQFDGGHPFSIAASNARAAIPANLAAGRVA